MQQTVKLIEVYFCDFQCDIYNLILIWKNRTCCQKAEKAPDVIEGHLQACSCQYRVCMYVCVCVFAARPSSYVIQQGGTGECRALPLSEPIRA